MVALTPIHIWAAKLEKEHPHSEGNKPLSNIVVCVFLSSLETDPCNSKMPLFFREGSSQLGVSEVWEVGEYIETGGGGTARWGMGGGTVRLPLGEESCREFSGENDSRNYGRLDAQLVQEAQHQGQRQAEVRGQSSRTVELALSFSIEQDWTRQVHSIHHHGHKPCFEGL